MRNFFFLILLFAITHQASTFAVDEKGINHESQDTAPSSDVIPPEGLPTDSVPQGAILPSSPEQPLSNRLNGASSKGVPGKAPQNFAPNTHGNPARPPFPQVVNPPAASPPAVSPQSPQPASPQQSAGSNSKVSSELQSFLEPFIYEMKGRRDPFKPFVEGVATSEDEADGPLLPLQQFDLEQIKLIGIIWDVRHPKAMFLDPNSQVHVLGRDERIGRNNGYIAVIREGEVVVVESAKVRGQNTFNSKVLKIVR